MNFPTIFDLLDRLAFLRGAPSAIVVLLAAAVAVVLWDVALSLGKDRAGARLNGSLLVFPALLALYLVGGLLFVDVLDPRLAVVSVIGGVFVALIVLVTGRQVSWGRPPASEVAHLTPGEMRPLGRLTVAGRTLLRLGLSAVVLLAVLLIARRGMVILPGVPEGAAYLQAVVLGLGGLGLVAVATTAEPLPGGVGLLVFLQGFALYYCMVDPSLPMVVALVILQLVVVLAASYLAQARRRPADTLN